MTKVNEICSPIRYCGALSENAFLNPVDSIRRLKVHSLQPQVIQSGLTKIITIQMFSSFPLTQAKCIN